MLAVKQLGQCIEMGASVRVHDALGTAGGARCVVDRDGSLFVVDAERERVIGAAAEEVVVPDVSFDVVHLRVRIVERHHLAQIRAVLEMSRPPTGYRPVSTTRIDAPECWRMYSISGPDSLVLIATRTRLGQRHTEVGDQHLGEVRHQIGHTIAGRRPRTPGAPAPAERSAAFISA